jgi:hypothetical protein
MRSRSLLGTVTLASALSLVPSVAHAAFGEKGDVSFAADRLMGVYFFNDDTKLTTVGLFAPPGVHPYMTARLGVDFFPINHLSIGGSFAFWDYDYRRAPRSNTSVLFSPRVGYAIDFTNSFGFWPRGGVTFISDGGDEFALTFEAMFWAAPAQHFAFTFGPVLDVDLAAPGNNAVSFGVLTAGILGWI